MSARVVVFVSEDTDLIVKEVQDLAAREGREAILFPETRLHAAHHWRQVAGRVLSDERLVIGTHSQAIVNEIGIVIGGGRLRCEDIQIRVLRVGEDDLVAGYTPDGALDDSWPFGFLLGE